MRTTAVLVAALAVALALGLAGCPIADDGCAAPSTCADPDPAPCDKCAPLPKTLCLAGKCVPRGDDAVAVTATVNVDRHLTTVQGFAFAVAAADRTCADVGSFAAFPADLNALSSGQLSFEGGTFHDGVSLGRVPPGDFLVLGLGTDAPAAGGNVVAHGCAAGTAAADPVAIDLALAP